MKLCSLNQIFNPEGRATSGILARHHAACDHCRANAQSARELSQKLRARGIDETAPPFLANRIMNALPTTKPQSSFGFVKWALPLAACAALALMLVNPPQQSPVPTVARATPKPEVTIPTSLPELSIPEDPLSKELEFILSDSQNAARTLAANFMPSDSF